MSDLAWWVVFAMGLVLGFALGVLAAVLVVLLEDAHHWRWR